MMIDDNELKRLRLDQYRQLHGSVGKQSSVNIKYNNLLLNDPNVANIIHSGGTPEDCVVMLAEINEKLTKRILILERFMPRRITLPSGKVMVWHCPDEFIPETGI